MNTTAATTFAPMPRPIGSIWGAIQSATELAPGIWSVSTASHGGLIISEERFNAMPAALRDIETFNQGAGVPVYEEDCDWCIPVLAWPTQFDAAMVLQAKRTFRGWIARKVPASVTAEYAGE